MPQKVWVPQPATKLYAAAGTDPETLRDRLVDQYGEGSVQRAEISCILDLLMIMRVVAPSEFVDMMQKKLYRIDQRRRAAANLDIDRG
jgi:hypothetical protein